MNKTTSLAVLIAGFTLCGSVIATAQAQDPSSAFIDVNGGGQTQARSLTSSSSFPLYGETAVISAAQGIDGGGFVDISGGYRITRYLGAALGVSVYSRNGNGAVAASIPSPTAFNKARTDSATASNLAHREIGTHLMVVWFVPIVEKLDVTVSAGPSFIRLTQDLISATVPAGTQTISTKSQSEKADATGVNAGVSLNYLVAPNYGIGGFVRYAGATANLPSAGDLKVGGLQLGGGLRLRF